MGIRELGEVEKACPQGGGKRVLRVGDAGGKDVPQLSVVVQGGGELRKTLGPPEDADRSRAVILASASCSLPLWVRIGPEAEP